MTCIKSPENYGQIVDIFYNTPYPFAAVAKRAALSLGARYDIVDDPMIVSDNEAVQFCQRLTDRLNLNSGRFLKKISAHLDIYGNSYVHIRRASDGLPDKVTILQPERMKIFLDPMTTKILFYVYLPPIIGGTLLTPYPYEKPNPNLIQNIALTYPTPIIIPPEDIIHLRQNDWTEYPFGFSLLRACMESAQARLDYTIISPIIYKHYSKPIIHWKLDPTGLNPNQVKTRMSAMKSQVSSMEPTSDMITTNKWESTVITGVSKGFSAALDMIADVDTQIFAAMGVPETYFKPRGTTDRMLAEQDKTFIKEMKDRQEYFFEELKMRLYYPALMTKFKDKYKNMDDIPRVKAQWRKMIMSDESIEIQNTIALLQIGIITMPEARRRLSLPPTADQRQKTLLAKFEGSPKEEMTKLLSAPQPIPLNAPGPGSPQPAGPSAGQAPGYLFQDKSEDGIKPNESPEDYYKRFEQAHGKPMGEYPKTQTARPTFAGIDDDTPVYMGGVAGKKAEIEVGDQSQVEGISARPCPYCRHKLFVSQDRLSGKESYRCENHGSIDFSV